MKLSPNAAAITPLKYFEKSKDGLLNAWFNEEGEGYAPDYQNVTGPFAKMTYKGLDRFRDRVVLDVGCNSGQNSLAASFYAKEIVGCEVQDVAFRRALRAKQFMEEEFDMNHLHFVQGDVSTHLDNRFDAMLACKVLYWVGDENIQRLRDFLSKKENFKIFIHTVPGREKVTTKAYNGMIEVNDVKKFLSDAGFSSLDEWEFTSRNGHQQVYIFAEKP